MLVIGLVAMVGLLTLAFDEGVLPTNVSVALFAATAAAWAYLLW